MATLGVKPGDVLGGKYRVERVLGTGGMGIVVAARHVDLDQRVALKFILKEAMTDPSAAERFLREARAAVQLKSNHTARVIDVGRLKNGDPFMVMEYLEGQDLDAELDVRGPLPPRVAADYIVQASEALAEAHGLGMVHRDVKLKNLFLTKSLDGRPLIKVLDFGLAKRLGSNTDVSLTATNSVFGSPQYMSPEQMRSAKDVDTRTDIWSLGICLFELLTGRRPFEAEGVAEICAAVLKDPVPRPSSFVTGIPIDLEETVLRCLEKDLSKRYQTVAELAFALHAYTSDEGSARRILHVMQTRQQMDTLTNLTAHAAGPAQHAPDDAKTMQGWDSNHARRAPPLLTKPQLYVLIGSFLFVGVIGVAMSAAVVKMKASRAAAASAASASPAPSQEQALVPTAEPSEPPTPAVPSVTTPTDPAVAADTSDPLPVPAPVPIPAPTSEPTTKAAAAGAPRPRPTPNSAKPSNPAPKASSKPKNGPGSGADYM
jgi:eukaryotic-like serine/threonine-protein kinase